MDVKLKLLLRLQQTGSNQPCSFCFIYCGDKIFVPLVSYSMITWGYSDAANIDFLSII